MRRPRRRCAPGPPRPRRAKKLPDGPRASVFDDIAHAHREIYALYQISQAMGTSLGLADTMSLVAAKLSSLVPFSACALFVYSESTERLHCRFATGTDSELMQQLEVRTGQGLNGWVARNRRPLVNARPSADLEAMGSNAPTVLQSALVCPLVIGERLIGTLAVYHVEPSFYREDHRRLLERVCEQAGAVVHNSVIFEQTQEDSLTDPLTGLPNTRSLFNHLTRELARAERLQVGGGAGRDGPQRLQGNQRHTSATSSATSHCGRSGTCCGRRSGPTTCAFATPATNSSSCCRDARAERPSTSAPSCRMP